MSWVQKWDRKQVVYRGGAFVFAVSGLAMWAAGSSALLVGLSLLVAIGLFVVAMRARSDR